MQIFRLILPGQYRVLRSPVQYRILSQSCIVKRCGDRVPSVPVDDPWWMMEAGLAAFEPGFRMRREDGIAEGVSAFHN